MQEQKVNIETAKLAREKGFDEVCYYIHDPDVGLVSNDKYHRNSKINVNNLDKTDYVTAPNQSLLQKWLRDRPTPIIVTPSTDFVSWEVEVRTPDEDPEVYWGTVGKEGRWFNSYEEALEAGLQEALKLIEIVKNK